jgi:hypothetical protein
MTNFQKNHPSRDRSMERRDRKFSVSANRGKASHRVRYVEAGGAAVDTEECTFCQSVPDLSANERETGGERSS